MQIPVHRQSWWPPALVGVRNSSVGSENWFRACFVTTTTTQKSTMIDNTGTFSRVWKQTSVFALELLGRLPRCPLSREGQLRWSVGFSTKLRNILHRSRSHSQPNSNPSCPVTLHLPTRPVARTKLPSGSSSGYPPSSEPKAILTHAGRSFRGPECFRRQADWERLRDLIYSRSSGR
ncbi:uncharacterized protein BT62DRAFT_298807 [Guyanagaster necrorhizus]|uniref:Uncharacterized protein n=1 Tax=Guyanagaster necrorhizus TaxID=856835 RepID=A0A9P7W6U7_9AGAR|nr:uncharacterized protein BT62DRAFT_298807 [Guyanagaster necrorhizus MCA 3950]KAG7452336.1 hypothetical protein BT62DRAFT_298807 [Guyanagaster necrorhizus MCA 3950]